MGSFGELIVLKQHHPKLGDTVVVEWKKENGAAWGIAGGFVIGVVGGGSLGEHLVLNGSTYQDSFKSNILSLGILDLHVIPMNFVKKIDKVSMRQRPPWTYEKFTMKMEACYESNIDFDATYQKVQDRTDCRAVPIRKAEKEAEYGITVDKIGAAEGAKVLVFSTGFLQIHCKHEQLKEIIEWVSKAFELLPGHKRFVLFSTKHTYRIYSNYREGARPTKEVIDRIAKAEGGPPISVLPIGWAHYFFGEVPDNPLQRLFPGLKPLEKFVIREGKRK